jgi:hypothetical protein
MRVPLFLHRIPSGSSDCSIAPCAEKHDATKSDTGLMCKINGNCHCNDFFLNLFDVVG